MKMVWVLEIQSGNSAALFVFDGMTNIIQNPPKCSFQTLNSKLAKMHANIKVHQSGKENGCLDTRIKIVQVALC